MTLEQYWARIKALGLTPTHVPHIFVDRDGQPHRIPDPEEMDEDEREDFVNRLMFRLGITGH